MRRERRALAWVLALGAVAVVTATVGVWLVWWASDLQHQVNDWYTAQTGLGYDTELARFYDDLNQAAYAVFVVASPLLAGTVFAILATVTVLAHRWDSRELIVRMIPRRVSRRWSVALLGFAVVCALLAVGFTGGSASILEQATAFGESAQSGDTTIQFTEEQWRFYNTLFMRSNALVSLVTPMLTAALAAAFGGLALLSMDRGPRVAKAVQAEVTAAS